MLSSHRSLCLPLSLPPQTVPCRIVLASPDDRVTCPYHFSLRLFTEVRRSSYGLMAFPILAFDFLIGYVISVRDTAHEDGSHNSIQSQSPSGKCIGLLGVKHQQLTTQQFPFLSWSLWCVFATKDYKGETFPRHSPGILAVAPLLLCLPVWSLITFQIVLFRLWADKRKTAQQKRTYTRKFWLKAWNRV